MQTKTMRNRCLVQDYLLANRNDFNKHFSRISLQLVKLNKIWFFYQISEKKALIWLKSDQFSLNLAVDVSQLHCTAANTMLNQQKPPSPFCLHCSLPYASHLSPFTSTTQNQLFIAQAYVSASFIQQLKTLWHSTMQKTKKQKPSQNRLLHTSIGNM